MKVNINKHGIIEITAETDVEAFALLHVTTGERGCNHCLGMKTSPIINCSILDRE